MDKIVIKKVSAIAYSKMLKDEIGEKREKAANELPSAMPTKGQFFDVAIKEATLKNGNKVKYSVLLVCDESLNEIGFVPIRSLLGSKSTGKTFEITKSGSEYKGLFGLASEPYNPHLLGSEAVIVESLCGKKFEITRQPDVAVPKLEFDEDTKKCLHFKPTIDEALQQFELKTIPLIKVL